MAEMSARQLMALLSRLTPGGSYRIDDIAGSLEVDAKDLRDSLITLSMCGVAPYDPDDCLPLVVQGETLYVTGELPGVRGAIRLSAAEARALFTALQAAGFAATDPLAERLLDAAATATFDAAELERTLRAAIDGHSPEVFEALSQAVPGRGVVRIAYTRAGTDEPTRRDIEPVALYAERGAWYVTAWCRLAGEWRTFRVDRMSSAGLTGERFAPRDDSRRPSPSNLDRLAALPRATLRFADPARYDARRWPGARVVGEEPDGGLIVEVPYGGTAWIARRVVAGLGSVEVTEPAEVRAAVAALAAEELAAETD